MPTPDLRHALARALEPDPGDPRAGRPMVILGVGAEMRSDDAAGVHVAAALAQAPIAGVHAINAGPAPESCTAEIRRLSPAQVIIVDSARMGEAPGAIRLIDSADIEAASFGTHGLPLKVLASYLRGEVGCRVTIIGIQPLSVDFGEGLSGDVAAAVAVVVRALRECLAPPSSTFMRS